MYNFISNNNWQVIFLANDWQAGLVQALASSTVLLFRSLSTCATSIDDTTATPRPVHFGTGSWKNGLPTQARCIYVIHNMGYQGQCAYKFCIAQKRSRKSAEA